MNRFTIILLPLVMSLALTSCGNRHGNTGKASEPSTDTLSVLLKSDRPAYTLCEQKLTSYDAVEAAFPNDSSFTYDTETTPISESFFYIGDGLKADENVRKAARSHNMCEVFNQTYFSYELYWRKITEMAEDRSVTYTHRDTLDIIAHDQPKISSDILSRAFASSKDRKMAVEMLRAYRAFDGDDSADSPFIASIIKSKEYIQSVPTLSDEALLNDFEEHFWEWYDKRNYVPEIDDIVRLSLGDTKRDLTDEEVENFRKAVLAEKVIDRRAILALEYAKHGHGGMILLGEIIESGQYTRYLLEVYIAWRAHVQMFHSPSSFAVIPNNYFEKMKVICMKTILRHMQTDANRYDACLVDNLIGIQPLSRQGSIAGNEALAILTNLQSGMFVHPRVLGKDYLKSEE